jgi:hypothetical protein
VWTARESVKVRLGSDRSGRRHLVKRFYDDALPASRCATRGRFQHCFPIEIVQPLRSPFGCDESPGCTRAQQAWDLRGVESSPRCSDKEVFYAS